MKINITPFITKEEIHRRIQEMAAKISSHFNHQPFVAIGVLNGSFIFFSDLIRSLNQELTCDFIACSSYFGTTSSFGKIKMNLSFNLNINNKDVLLVDDIVDTGLSMNFLRRFILSHHPKSLSIATLLFKPEALKEECPLDFVGFEIKNEFVVGYGLDYQGFFRNLPFIGFIDSVN